MCLAGAATLPETDTTDSVNPNRNPSSGSPSDRDYRRRSDARVRLLPRAIVVNLRWTVPLDPADLLLSLVVVVIRVTAKAAEAAAQADLGVHSGTGPVGIGSVEL